MCNFIYTVIKAMWFYVIRLTCDYTATQLWNNGLYTKKNGKDNYLVSENGASKKIVGHSKPVINIFLRSRWMLSNLSLLSPVFIGCSWGRVWCRICFGTPYWWNSLQCKFFNINNCILLYVLYMNNSLWEAILNQR